MKPSSWFSLFMVSAFLLAGCTSYVRMVKPTQEMQLPSPTNLPAADTVAPTLTPTLAISQTSSPTATQTLLATLGPESIKETIQPLLKDPLNCAEPCFMGITPGKTTLDDVRAFFTPLGLPFREGPDPNSSRIYGYSVIYESYIGRDSSVSIYTSNNLVENIVITPEIIKQKEGSPREWVAYSPETIIKKYGQPSRVYFALDLGQVATTVNMIMYFDKIHLIALYSGIGNTPQFCPFTFPFDDVRLWMGEAPPDPPLFPMMPLEKVTGLSIDQFTQLMLGDPKQACFILNENVFK